jgi:DUF4097 and DUF4098 domain-containing protein YvlB
MYRTRIALVAALLGLLTLSAKAAIDSPVQRSFGVRDGGTLYLDTDVGNVHVSAGGGGVGVLVKRHARNQKQLDDMHLDFSQQGNDVHVTARYDSDWHFFSFGNDFDVTFEVTVPSRYNLEVKTSGGNVTVGDLHGFVHARTSGGNVRLAHIDGPVEAHTSGGNVHLDAANGNTLLHTSGGGIAAGNVSGNVDMRSSGGSLEVHRVTGTLLARTSGGSIRIDDALGAVDAQTSGGSIHARISGQPRGDSRLSTSGGGITLEVSDRIAVDLDAHSSGGGVHTDVPITTSGSIDEGKLVGKINGGGPKLVLRSSGGGIHVRKL